MGKSYSTKGYVDDRKDRNHLNDFYLLFLNSVVVYRISVSYAHRTILNLRHSESVFIGFYTAAQLCMSHAVFPMHVLHARYKVSVFVRIVLMKWLFVESFFFSIGDSYDNS
jgi:hypothetical protein